MEHYLLIWSVVSWVESRVTQPRDDPGMAADSGYSLVYVRELFSRYTGKSLAAYTTERRVAHAARDLITTRDSIREIGRRYGYHCPDTFTRAVRRVTGRTPEALRQEKPAVRQIRLCAGVTGPGLPQTGGEPHERNRHHPQ